MLLQNNKTFLGFKKTVGRILIIMAFVSIGTAGFAATPANTYTLTLPSNLPQLSVNQTSAPATFIVTNTTANSAMHYVDWTAGNLGWNITSTTCNMLNGSNANESQFYLAGKESSGKASCSITGTFTPMQIGSQVFGAQLFIGHNKLLSATPTPQQITFNVFPVGSQPVVIAKLKTSFPSTFEKGNPVTATYNLTTSGKLNSVAVSFDSSVKGAPVANVAACQNLAAFSRCDFTITLQPDQLGDFVAFKPIITVSNTQTFPVPAAQIDATNAFTVTRGVQLAITLTQNFDTYLVLVGELAPVATYLVTSPEAISTLVIGNLPSYIASRNSCDQFKSGYSCIITLTMDTSVPNVFPATVPVIIVNGQNVANVEQLDGVKIGHEVNVLETSSPENAFPAYAVINKSITAKYTLTNNEDRMSSFSNPTITNLLPGMTSDIGQMCASLRLADSCTFTITYTPTTATMITNFVPETSLVEGNASYTADTSGVTPALIHILGLNLVNGLSGQIQKIVTDPITNNIFMLTLNTSTGAETPTNQKLYRSTDHGVTWTTINLGNLATFMNMPNADLSDITVANGTVYAIGRVIYYDPSGQIKDWMAVPIVAVVGSVQKGTAEWTSFSKPDGYWNYYFSMDAYVSPDGKQSVLYLSGMAGLWAKSLTNTEAAWQMIMSAKEGGLNVNISDATLIQGKTSGILYYQNNDKRIGREQSQQNFMQSLIDPLTEMATTWFSIRNYTVASTSCGMHDQIAIQNVLGMDTIYDLPNLCGGKWGELQQQSARNTPFVPVILPSGAGIVNSIAANDQLLVVGTTTGVFVSPDQGNTWVNVSVALGNSPLLPIAKVAIDANGLILVSDSNHQVYSA